MRHLPRAAFTLILMIAGGCTAIADDHIVKTYSRSYMGRNYPPQTREYWISEQGTVQNLGWIRIIQRRDLGKTWILNMTSKRYLEEPLDGKGSSETSTAPTRIQERGFDYTPRFEWLAEKTQEAEIIDGWPCEKWILRGDADYAEEVQEIWYASEVPIDAKRHFDVLLKPGSDANESLEKLYREHPELRSMFPIRTVITTENAIAPVMVGRFDVTTLEQTTPPENLYDIPEGFTRVDSRDALYAR